MLWRTIRLFVFLFKVQPFLQNTTSVYLLYTTYTDTPDYTGTGTQRRQPAAWNWIWGRSQVGFLRERSVDDLLSKNINVSSKIKTLPVGWKYSNVDFVRPLLPSFKDPSRLLPFSIFRSQRQYVSMSPALSSVLPIYCRLCFIVQTIGSCFARAFSAQIGYFSYKISPNIHKIWIQPKCMEMKIMTRF